ncbi:MAG: hypothetical protein J0I40_12665 [Cellulomonas sp.]|nr:hypothetical protein [Cellulomonas sp.]
MRHVKIERGQALTTRTLPLTNPGLRTPVLIPSISSKGFPLLENGESETANVLRLVAPQLTHSLLISAYDIHHRRLPDVDLLLNGQHHESSYSYPDLLVVDSGGYELSDVYESGEVGRGPREVLPFTREQHSQILELLPSDRDILAVTYDDQRKLRPSYDEQVQSARSMATDYPRLLIDFLVKPAQSAQYINIDKLTPALPDARQFAVIGFTEKELGQTILDRLVSLAKIRRRLDESGLSALPIHVFGGLDPLMTTLYFMCGAEVFDGLSWLRYAYVDGLAIHEAELAILANAIEDRADRRDARRHLTNLAYLRDFQHRLERWAAEPRRYELLGAHHERLREIYELVRAREGGT